MGDRLMLNYKKERKKNNNKNKMIEKKKYLYKNQQKN